MGKAFSPEKWYRLSGIIVIILFLGTKGELMILVIYVCCLT